MAAKKKAAEAEAAAADGGSGSSGCPHLASQGGEGDSTASEGATSLGKCPHHTDGALAASEAAAVAAAESGDAAATNAAMKAHFTAAYNAVADAVDAGEKGMGDVEVARVLVERLGYTPAQIEVIGADVSRMQGTGNPHAHADLQAGETVVDLGSGFGIDAFLAGYAVGDTGRVIGVDMSEGEVLAAVRRVAERRLVNVDFRIGDIEAIPVADGAVDCVISNGGFCLVPDKRQAFREIFRVLRPGGRFSISCTVKRQSLDASIKWPSCMHVFMPLDEADDIIGGAGFVDLAVDDSNSSMSLWDEEEAAALKARKKDESDAKVGVHRGDPAYAHLGAFNMDDLCARVTIHARKPDSSE